MMMRNLIRMKYNRTKVLGIWLAKSNPVERTMIVGREMRTREKRVKLEQRLRRGVGGRSARSPRCGRPL